MQIRNAIKATILSCAVAVVSSAAANAQSVQFFAVLDGGNEVSGATAATGDTNGFGTASVLLGASGQLCFSLLVRGIGTPTAAHIHQANPGAAGPIVIPLTPVPSSGNPGSSSGCLTGLSAMTISQIRSNPGKFYINVHTGSFSAGAVRGQLF